MPTPHHTHTPNDKDREPVPMSRRFFTACLLILAGLIALTVATDLLARIWGWLVLAALIAATVWVIVRVVRARRDRW